MEYRSMFSSFWETQCGANPCFFSIRNSLFHHSKKSSFWPPFWRPKVTSGPENTSLFALIFVYFWWLKIMETSILSTIYSTSWGSAICYFAWRQATLYGFSASVFCTPLEAVLAHFDRSRASPNRHPTFKNDALVETKHHFSKNHYFS